VGRREFINIGTLERRGDEDAEKAARAENRPKLLKSYPPKRGKKIWKNFESNIERSFGRKNEE